MPAKSHPVSVVTGGAGFLRSHLTDRFLAEGHRVIAIDNLVTGNVELAALRLLRQVLMNCSGSLRPSLEECDA